jgi:predicted esterase
MSNGAIFAEMLALALPDRIAAAAGHSGALPPKYPIPNACRHAPMILVVGEEDQPGMADAVQTTAEELRAAGHDVEVIVRPGLGHEWDTSQSRVIWRFLQRFPLPRM